MALGLVLGLLLVWGNAMSISAFPDPLALGGWGALSSGSGYETSTEARTCNEVLEELSEKGIRTFVNAIPDTSPADSLLKRELCIDTNAEPQVERYYYYCDEQFDARVFLFDTPENRNDLSNVIDLDEVRDMLNTSDVLLFCVLRPQPSTAPPPTRAPTPLPPSLGRCPGGPFRVDQYIIQSRGALCRRRCSFRVAADGASIGARTRTIYRCCNGEPIIVSLASRLYRCP